MVLPAARPRRAAPEETGSGRCSSDVRLWTLQKLLCQQGRDRPAGAPWDFGSSHFGYIECAITSERLFVIAHSRESGVVRSQQRVQSV